MEFDPQIGLAVEQPGTMAQAGSRPYRPRSESELAIGQLYLQLLNEPVPPRLLNILRSALAPES